MLGLVLATNVPYTRFHGGANRSNKALAEALAARGHRVTVITPALSSPPQETLEEWRSARLTEGASLKPTSDGYRFELNGVSVLAVADQGRMLPAFAEAVVRERPDWVLVSSEDPSQALLSAALDAAPGRVAYLALTPQLFPFGPESLYPGEARTEMVRRCRLRLVLSKAAADYVERWSGVTAEIYAPPHFGSGPFPVLGDPSGAALLINASQIKGLPIFLELARRFPGRRFWALPGYATTAADRAAIAALPNMEMRPNRPSLDDVLSGVSVVLMPSLWFESFGMAAVDSMLRGIPVLASDHGALPEALLGTRSPLPVRPIEGYRDSLEDNLLLQPVVPEQDIGPWRDALAALWDSPDEYPVISQSVRRAAQAFADAGSVASVERLLEEGSATAAPLAGSLRPSKPETSAGATLSPSQKSEMLRRVRERRSGAARLVKSGIPAVSRDGLLPLSPGQRRLYFLQRLEPDAGAYNTAFLLRLRGNLDQSALARALDALAERHEALRSVIVERDGAPSQRILPEASLSLETVDAADDESALRALRDRAARPFDLTAAAPARVHLASLSDTDHLLLFVIHHIATDAWSTGILVDDLAALYSGFVEGHPADLPPPGAAFVDYAAWLEAAAETGRGHEDYWVERLSDAPTAINLPSDRPRPAVRRQLGDSLPISFDGELIDGAGRIARDQGATLFMAMLTAWLVVLHRLGGDDDLVIGIPVANRGRAEIERTVGFFVNTLPLRLDVSGNPTFRDLLAHVRDLFITGLEHAEVPFERIVERLNVPRSRSHGPLVQTLFGLHNAGGEIPTLAGVEAEPVAVHNGTAKFDLNVELAETEGTVEGSVEFDTELFDPQTIERMVDVWRTVLAAFVADPEARIGAVPLLSPARTEALHRGLNPPATPLAPSDSIAARLRAAAARTPQAEALRIGSATMTYGELDRWTDRLAAGLVGRGVGPDVSVAFATERGFERIAAMIAILKAGGACVPLDLALPADRLRHIVANSQAPFILTQATTRARVAPLGGPLVEINDLEAGASSPLPETIPHDAIAYILYTSGSTGEPKGVAYPQGAELNLMLWFNDRFSEPARSMQFASIGFDASFNESLSTLMVGGTLNLLTDAERADILAAVDAYLDQNIERAIVSVVLLNLLAERVLARPPERLSLREIIATGEQLKITPSVERMLAAYPDIRLFNDYGPTESNVITALDVTGRADHYGALPPIGRPVRSARCYVLDRYLHPVPAGMPGELYLAGSALARGYSGRPAFTASAFLPDPFASAAGERMYRSGDIARLRDDGELELIGRADDQLKIRGFRVEPAEVEIALRAQPSVGDCLVIARTFPGDDRRLVAYVVAGAGPAPDPSVLRSALADRLPDYMVPAHIVVIGAFELNANGKIDRARLPMPETERELGEGLAAPRTEIEETLLRLWQDVLDVRAIDIRDDFFSLGGHSLLIIRIIARLREELGVELPLAAFLDGPTIEQLAVTVTALLAEGEEEDLERLLSEIEGAEIEGADIEGADIEGADIEESDSGSGETPTLEPEALRRSLLSHAADAEPGTEIAAIGVPSSNRPDILAGCLTSYLDNCAAYGRRPEIVVCGRQRDRQTDAAYRRVLGDIATRYETAVSYAGAPEADRFAQRLADVAGVDPAVVRFALSDSEGVGLPYGVNRNALLLHNAGRAFVSVDDDTRGVFRRYGPAEPGLIVTSEPGVSEIRVLGSREDALAEVEPEAIDWLGRHGEALGADAAALLAIDPDRPLDTHQAARGSFGRLSCGEGRVALTYQGWVGDSGWAGSEEARWLTGASFDWITETAERYAAALASREVVRGVRGLTLSRGGDFFCLSAGFDARRPLVPFLPVQRREDALFGWLATLVDESALVAHLPGMVQHDRAGGGLPALLDAVDLAALIRAALSDETGLSGPPEARLENLGARLVAACAAPPDRFDAWIRERALTDMERDLESVEARISTCPSERDYWARDAELAVQFARRKLQEADSHLPRSLGLRLDREARVQRLRLVLSRYGALMEAWPTLMASAAALRSSGDGLAPALVAEPVAQ
ncbi:MAG: amino acid adenylation domain-containing protein [Alphaproteobacteria bacterium]|nr:amino acid adenylation domain-containing protein [Alphaproteobacteria bacterium]